MGLPERGLLLSTTAVHHVAHHLTHCQTHSCIKHWVAATATAVGHIVHHVKLTHFTVAIKVLIEDVDLFYPSDVLRLPDQR